jgi:predicted nucleotidyltransferase
MVGHPVLQAFLAWAERTSHVRAVTLFGALARGEATASSDVDVQVVTSAPADFHDDRWLAQVPALHPRAYAVREATGGARKATALLDEGDIDLVIVAHRRLLLARLAVAAGLHRRSPGVRAALGPLAIVLRPGHRVLKGGVAWERFYAAVVRDVPDPRIGDAEARALGERAYVDAVWILRKLQHGEVIAAQRWLHKTPVEVNLRLLNEWRLRRGLSPCFDARRAERLLPAEELELVRIDAALAPEPLARATRKALATTRRLVEALTGAPPRWPEV